MNREIRQAVRSFLRQPGLWALAVITLAAGVGASVAVFALNRNIFERPLASLDRDRTAVLVMAHERNGVTRERFSAADWEAFQRTQSYEAVEAYRRENLTLASASEPQRLPAASISRGVFTLSSGKVAMGRTFSPGDYETGAAPVVILSDAFWRSHFQGRASALGERLTLNGDAATVVGVAAPGTWFPATTVNLWRPLRTAATARAERDLQVVALLKPGATLASAEAEARQISKNLAQAYPDTNAGWTVRTLDPIAGFFSENDKQSRVLLLVLAAGILLLAAVNVANLILSRSMLRRQELAIRQSLGASRRALLRQGFAEGLVIAVPAAVLGITAAIWSSFGVLKLMAFLPYPLPDQPLDAVGVGLGLGSAALTALLFAALPLFSSYRSSSLREEQTRGTTSRSNRRLASAFVAVQTALAMMLLTAAGFAVRGVSLIQEQADHPGFERENLATLAVAPDLARYPRASDRAGLFRRMQAAAAAVPGVEAVAVSSVVPTAESDGQAMRLALEGRAEADEKNLPTAMVLRGSATLAAALHLPLKAGRFLEASDDESHPPVAVINQHAARRFWPGADPVGRRIQLKNLDGAPWLTVVGVYRDMAASNLRLQPQVIVAQEQFPSERATVIVRFRGAADEMVRPIRQAVQAASPLEPLQVDTVAGKLDAGIKGSRLFAGILSVLGVLALLLGAVGTFSLLSFQVLERMREIGIRVALGAGERRIAGLVLSNGFRLTLWGVLLGLPGAWLVARVLAGLMPSLLKVGDPAVASATFGAIALGTLFACIAPALRALRANPADLMRQG